MNVAMGFFPLPKKLSIQVKVLKDEKGDPVLDNTELKDLEITIASAKNIFKDKFNIEILPFKDPMIQIMPDKAPKAALDVHCDLRAFKEDVSAAGAYFNSHLSGWNAFPTSRKFPITVFIVRDVWDKLGCSMGVLSEYVTVSKAGVKDTTTWHMSLPIVVVCFTEKRK